MSALKQNKSLNEVVVVGYGTVKKSDVTGAVTQVGEADIKATTKNRSPRPGYAGSGGLGYSGAPPPIRRGQGARLPSASGHWLGQRGQRTAVRDRRVSNR